MYLNREQIIALSFLFIFLILGLLLQELQPQKRTFSAFKKPTQLPTFTKNSDWILVHLKGAIHHPGNYFIPKNIKLKKVIQLAGGLSDSANPSQIVQDSKLKNKHIYFIPFKKKQKLKPVKIEVEITGAVYKPGVYELLHGSRLATLIDLAHGLLPNAKNKPLKNYFLKDGQSFFIPFFKKRIKSK